MLHCKHALDSSLELEQHEDLEDDGYEACLCEAKNKLTGKKLG